MNANNHIASLLIKHFNRETDAREEIMVQQWLEEDEENRLLYNSWLNRQTLEKKLQIYNDSNKEEAWDAFKEKIQPAKLRKMRWRQAVAAVAILAIGWGSYYLINQSHKSKIVADGEEYTKVDIAPGTNRAVLTINNKQQIDLATDKTGININNAITYNDGEKIADAGQLLQLSTPRGGQYQAILPDGSKIWLNAASSIKFPSKFNNKERRVEVTGEVYFEIMKDAARPFKVSGGGQEIVVLGTSFNVNIYEDEPVKKTTLLTGRILVTPFATNRSVTLKPGEQAQLVGNQLTTIKQPEEDAMAWKNGYFSFDKADLKVVMRQLARWYDLEVDYQGNIPARRFTGGMQRSLSLLKVLKILKDNNIKFEMNDRKITLL